MKANNTRRMRRLLALALTVCLLSCLAISAFADSENTAVNEAANGTLRFNWYFAPEEGSRILWYSSSCFLINEDTIVTNASCAMFYNDLDFADSGLMQFYSEATGNKNFGLEDFMQLYDNEYSVTVTRDVTVDATLVQYSAEMDFAILKLDTPIKNKIILPLRDSETVKTTENVYAIGFPAASYDIQTTTTASSADVTITRGNVIKITRGLNTWLGYNGEIAEMVGLNTKDLGYQECDLILSDCQLGGGVTGGPMVDDNGSVIAICEGSYGDKYFYSIPINQVTDVCDALGIEYTGTGAVPAEPAVPAAAEPAEPAAADTPAVDTAALEKAITSAKALDPEAYTEESYKSLTDAIAVAESALAAASTQSSVNSALSSVNAAVSALEEQKGLSTTTLIILIAAVALVAVVVIVVALTSSAKKKNAKKTAAAVASRTAAPETQSTSAATGPVVGTTTSIQSAGETTILGGEAGSTTVLVHGGSLVRVRTGQKVELSSSEITIGRDAKNTYAIKDVSSISRNHAKISIRNRTAYLKDLGAANGTTINGVKLNPNQEQALKDGDKISFAEEEFEYHQ